MSEPECHSGGKPEKRAHEHTEASSEIGEHGGRGHSDKRNEDADDEDVGWIGPTLSEAAPAKKKRVLAHEKLYLSNLPNADTYERSYMHRDVVTHCIVTKTDFVVTASIDGHIKFWKKQDVGIEFVKHFRAHLGNIQDLAANISGSLAVSISNDQHAKIFDVMNFDMINILKLDYVPFCCCWIHAASDAIALLAIAESSSPIIRVYDARGASSPLHSIDRMHLKPVLCMTYNAMLDVVISGDAGGIIEYWWGNKGGYQFPEKDVTFSAKLDTDLFDFVKHKTKPLSLCVSPDGKYFAASAEDGRIRVFRFHSGCLFFVIDESLSHYTALQSEKQPFPSMDFNKKVSYEKDLHKSESHRFSNLVFDQTGYYLLYSSMIGVKLVNLHTKKCVAVIGKSENLRCLHIALWQKDLSAGGGLTSMEESVSDKFNEHLTNDPTLVCTAFRKSRFYMFTRRMAKDSSSSSDRDVFNEKPSQEERIAVSDDSKGGPRLFETAVLHTTVGDIFLKLFPSECPRTVENFCMHAKNSYYNGHIFHRVIKQFMIQTGDPTGIGTGGQSIWGGEFEDEFHPKLRHDRPYTVSMANAGPNTNGSQFFITVVPAPWLDNKHTVFGRVVRGMEVAQSISNAKTSSKTDKPYDDISILSVTVKDPFRV